MRIYNDGAAFILSLPQVWQWARNAFGKIPDFVLMALVAWVSQANFLRTLSFLPVES
ncbi:MAG: hypothetical protein RBT42_15810 [Aquabacterium sp.]|uniref:hypothetical protein n=1 Tax=Aquabacterium sp. TaxID=1872578 RepID=UPI002A36B7F2|nr:hypothetical protein [Aquabacterium sp.]MDX9845199.1 hypothetical protein [Aquabacterium sp.]